MDSAAIKSIAICVLGLATLAGCASSSPSRTAATTAATGTTAKALQTGQVTAVESTAVVDQAVVGSTSGRSTVVTTASGGPSLLTVQFSDGTRGKYIIDNPTAKHTVGEQVYVITDGDRVTIAPRQ